MSMEFIIKPSVVMNSSGNHSKEELSEILDTLIGAMTGSEIRYWVENGRYVWVVKDKMEDNT